MKAKQKTVRVRIAVVVNEHGNYHATGWRYDGKQGADKNMMAIAIDMFDEVANEQHLFVEADVPIPKTVTVKGKVVK